MAGTRPSNTPQIEPLPLPDLVLLSSRPITDMNLHLVLAFGYELEARRLLRAWEALVPLLPELGFRLGFRRGVWGLRPYYEPSATPPALTELTLPTQSDPVRSADPSTGHIAAFTAQPLDPRRGLAALLLTHTEAGDVLVLKVHHMLADARSLGGIGEALARAYSNINPDDRTPMALPAPVPPPRDRRLRRAYAHLDAKGMVRMLAGSVEEQCRSLAGRASWLLPPARYAAPHSGPVPAYEVRHLSKTAATAPQRLKPLFGCTVNDVLLTAHVRACAALALCLPRHPFPIRTTVDLRRYLSDPPAGEALPSTPPPANLSGWFYPHVPHQALHLGSSFTETLGAVMKANAGLAHPVAGLGEWCLHGLLFTLPFPLASKVFQTLAPQVFRRATVFPPFSNLGRLDQEGLGFGSLPPELAYVLIPALVPPYVFVGASGFSGGLTLSAGFTEDPRLRRTAAGLLKLMERELAHAGI